MNQVPVSAVHWNVIFFYIGVNEGCYIKNWLWWE